VDAKDRSERQFISICNALEITRATLTNGITAASLPDLLNGVYHMTRHTQIEGGADRHVEVAFRLRSFGSVRQCRLGASVAANLMCDPEIAPWLTQNDLPPPWVTHTDAWRGLLTFQLRTAETFMDLDEQSYSFLLGKPSSHAGNFNETVALNRRKETDKYNGTNLGVRDNARPS